MSEKVNSKIISIPVSNEIYWEVFREMKEEDPMLTFSDNRVVDHNLIILRLKKRNLVVVIKCKEEISIDRKI